MQGIESQTPHYETDTQLISWVYHFGCQTAPNFILNVCWLQKRHSTAKDFSYPTGVAKEIQQYKMDMIGK